jgi:hypothetical protein
LDDVLSKLHFNPILLTILLILPPLCFSVCFLNAFRKFNKKLLYLTVIIFLFITFNIYMYFTGTLALTVRYILIVLPLILLICSDGLLSIKIKYLKEILISLILIIYLFNIFNYKTMPVFNFRKSAIKEFTIALKELNIDDNDYILNPTLPVDTYKYPVKGNIIPFSYGRIETQDKTKREALKMFDKDLVRVTNTKTSLETLLPYFKSFQPTPELTDFIDSCIDKIPKGGKLFFIDNLVEEQHLINLHTFLSTYNDKSPKEAFYFYKKKIYRIFELRFYEDLCNILDNNPSLKKMNESIRIINSQNSPLIIRVYKKL